LSTNITWHEHTIQKSDRVEKYGQKPCMVWFTGLSGSGKSTVANALEKELFARGHKTYLLDGDNVRHGLNSDLGFDDKSREENIRRIGEVAKLFLDAGLIVICSFISPFKKEREFVRSLVEDGEFIEVFVDTPIEICEQRDPKGLYRKARNGEISDFTGIDSVYERPEKAEVTLCTIGKSVLELVDLIKRYFENIK
jgi:adenylyl-sulfate kinase